MKIEPTMLADIESTLPERISPPECYATSDKPVQVATVIKQHVPVQNFFEATESLQSLQSLQSLFDDDSSLDELVEEHDLIF